jgi:hypothetical protein
MRREILAALSLANLWYVRVWSELLTYTRADAYLMVHPPRPADYLAVMANVLLLAAIFLGLHAAAVRLLGGNSRWRFAEMAFVASLVIPLNGVRELLSRHFPYLKSPLIDLIGVRGVLALVSVLAIGGLVAVFVFHRGVTRGAVAALTVLAPFCAITFGQGIWRASKYDESAYRNKPPAPPLADAKRSHRVVWFICDEWDYRLTFPDRDRTLALPEIDRLAAESLSASNAYGPGSGTPEAIPSYYAGRLYSPVWQEGVSRMTIFPKGEKQGEVWGAQPSVFDRAREAGFQTALLDWYHPTCRVLGNLNFCEWWPMARQYNSMGDRFSEILPRQTRSLFETNIFSLFGRPITADQHTAVYHQMMARALQVATNPDYGFSVIHLPIPHNPFMYDRRTRTFTLGNSPIKGYIDHLALLDRAIGELRGAMEHAGMWDSTTVLFTSDHENRQSISLDGKEDYRIPYLLKLASQKSGAAISERFNSVVTSELLLAVLRGEVSAPQEAAGWLRAHASHAVAER